MDNIKNDKPIVIILGGNGLLGKKVVEKFAESKQFITIPTYRDITKISEHLEGIKIIPAINYFDFDANICLANDNSMFKRKIKAIKNVFGNNIYILNCIGDVSRHGKQNKYKQTIFNTLFPHWLEKQCLNEDLKLIHISTNCIFNLGIDNHKTEHICTTSHDYYGISKFAGEVGMTIRASFVGNTNRKNSDDLISWLRSQNGRQVDGYVNHWWNGLTTDCLADILKQIILNDMWKEGVFHVFSDRKITKCTLLFYLVNKFGLDIYINPVEAKSDVFGDIYTFKPYFYNILTIPTIERQIEDMI